MSLVLNNSSYSPHQAAYFAHELTRRAASDDASKLGTSLFNATIDLNPHQVDAALFAFKSPLSRGAILADEVGLGKTIEAGLLVSQLWAERKRRIVVICPTMLRKQWAQELQEKFGVESLVLDAKVEKALWKEKTDPFDLASQVVICSHEYAARRFGEISMVDWDLIVIDEAHRLRNVWKNENGRAAQIKKAVKDQPLVMLTATPLQNSLMELYGLVSFIDEHVFGDLDAFKSRYMRGTSDERELVDLRARIKPLLQRTLRRDVAEYVKYTSRRVMVEAFDPHDDEQALYEKVSEFLQRPNTVAFPTNTRHLLTLVVRKILASSSFAIGNTLQTLVNRLREKHGDLIETLDADYETADELRDEADAPVGTDVPLDPAIVAAEIAELERFLAEARAIGRNAKGDALVTALEKGFEKMEELGAPRKAVVFTESVRTQEYLFELLTANGYGGRIVSINGQNKGPEAARIYGEWVERHRGEAVATGNKDIDLRAALVEEFRGGSEILLATEAAGEGINLQFCSLLVNYDLPWNPQRVEQRIGRCHRYGQKFDVVVVNFLNRKNAADQRVLELLQDKLHLFEGMFGASDAVLGALESGIDFEQRILKIVQECRTEAQINAQFDALQDELAKEIAERIDETQQKVLQNFNPEVRDRLKELDGEIGTRLGELESFLWRLTLAELDGMAAYEAGYRFRLSDEAAQSFGVGPGAYRIGKGTEEMHGAQRYRPDHPLAQRLVERAQGRPLEPVALTLTYDANEGFDGMLDAQVGRSGWLGLSRLTLRSRDEEDLLLFAALDDAGQPLPEGFAAKLLRQPCVGSAPVEVPEAVHRSLDETTLRGRNAALGELEGRNARYFEAEIEKLDRWGDDRRHGLETAIRDLDKAIKVLVKEARLAATLEEKIERQRQKASRDTERGRRIRELFVAGDEIDAEKAKLLDKVQARLKAETEVVPVLLVRWALDGEGKD